jgi:tetratricopeptide (TPR) repeat protein
VRVSLSSVVLLKADNLVRSGKVMTVDGNGVVTAVPAFASGVLTRLRPGAEVMRFKQEDVKGARAEGVLAGVTDALGGVAAALGSSGLVEVEEGSRLFGMHQLLQQAVRAELGDTHDDAMAALLEARCGYMGDEYRIDHRMHSVMREVVAAAGHVLDGIKAAAAQRTVWVCGMRVRVLQMARTVLGGQNLEVLAYHHALDADLSALGVERGWPVAAEYRAMDWWRKCCSGNKHFNEALIRDIEDAESSTRDLSAGWDCRAALGNAQHAAGNLMHTEGNYDKAIEFLQRALCIRTATLGEMHADTAVTISSMGASYNNNGQYDRAIELYERALPIQVATLGEMHAETAGTIGNMGTSYGEQGQQDRAIELYERALRIQVATLEEMHAEAAVTIGSMGASYSEKGQHDRAIELYERALRIHEATLGEMHTHTAQCVINLGLSYGNKGQFDRAITEAQRALRICLKVLGPHHPQTQQTQQSLANITSVAARARAGRGRH